MIAPRPAVAHQLHEALRAMQGGAARHEPRALARRAALRRGAGRPFGETAAADAALLNILRLPAGADGGPPPLTPALGRLLDDALVIASLVASSGVQVRSLPARQDDSRAARPPRSFGHDLRPLTGSRDTTVADDLLRALLSADVTELPRHMRRTFALLASDGHSVDVDVLILDLGRWEDEDRRVQKRWAYDFWGRAELTEPTGHDDREQA